VALVVWWVWVVFAAANVLDLAIQGHNHFSVVVILILVLITGITFAAAFRPRVIADDEGMTVRNPVRDHRLPWGCVERLELGDTLEIYCGWQDGGPRRKKLYAWAVHSPRRSRLKAEMRARRADQDADKKPLAKLPPEARAALGKTDAQHIVESLRARGDKARAAGAAGTVGGKLVSRWDPLAAAVLVIPLLAVIAALLT
jgi:hypothetical protein